MAFVDIEMPEEFAESQRGPDGRVPNYAKVFAGRPAVYAAWQQLNAAIKQQMDLRRYELATFAAAARLRSSYCSLAHGQVLTQRFLSEQDLEAVATDRSAVLGDIDDAVMSLAEQVASDAGAVDQAGVDRLRALGLTDQDIVDVVLAATARCFFSKTLDALGVLPDPGYAEFGSERLRSALVTGRPIEAAPE